MGCVYPNAGIRDGLLSRRLVVHEPIIVCMIFSAGGLGVCIITLERTPKKTKIIT
jgi:hypothetical protein